jgi:hypothetical protein
MFMSFSDSSIILETTPFPIEYINPISVFISRSVILPMFHPEISKVGEFTVHDLSCFNGLGQKSLVLPESSDCLSNWTAPNESVLSLVNEVFRDVTATLTLLQEYGGITLTEVKLMIILLEKVLTESCDSNPFVLHSENCVIALISAFHLVHKTLSVDIGWQLHEMATVFRIPLDWALKSELFLLTLLGWRVWVDRKDVEAASSLLEKVIGKFGE